MAESMPSILVQFNEPQHGFWNGGAKYGGSFEPTPATGNLVKWGCWELNYWFTSSFGGSWKKAAEIAHRKIKRIIRPANKVNTIWS